MKWNVVVPANSKALFSAAKTKASDYKLNGSAAAVGGAIEAGRHPGEFVLPAGVYHFTATLQPASAETADASR